MVLDWLSYRRAGRVVGISKTEVGDSMDLLLGPLAAPRLPPARRQLRHHPCLAATVGVAVSTSGAARTLAALAAGGALIVLVGSAAWLVPIQRRLVAPGPQPAAADAERLRARWLRGHLARTAVALAFLLLAAAAV